VFKKIKSSISHRALNRRRYIPFEKTTKLEYEVLEKWLMPPISEEIRNRILLLPKFFQGLDKAKKSGGWSSKIVFNKKIFLWRVSYFSYWKPIYKKFYEVGGHSQNIKSLELRKYLNVEYISQSMPGNSLNMYSFFITFQNQNSAKIILDRAITLEFSAGYAFQHFIDHAYAYINFLSEFLKKNPEVHVILPSPNKSFIDREFLLNKIGVLNPIHNAIAGNSINIRELIVLKALPKDILYSVPYSLTNLLSSKVNSELKSTKNKKIALIIREEKNRNFNDLNEIIDQLSNFASNNGLELEPIYPNRISTKELANLLSDCLIFVGLHGGAMCNLLFMPKNSYILEIVPDKEGASLFHLAIGGGFKYLPIPMNYELGTTAVNIKMSDLNSALDFVLADLNKIKG
jgi:hypothetical protein